MVNADGVVVVGDGQWWSGILNTDGCGGGTVDDSARTSVFGLGDFCASLRSHNTLLINLLLPNIPINTTHE